MPGARADACLDRATAQSDMNACAAEAYAASDSRLNGLYRNIQRRLKGDPGSSARLAAAQRAWLAFRDTGCRFLSSDDGHQGIAFPMVHDLCLEKLTDRRVRDFKAYLSCSGSGDVGCPVP